MNKNDSITNPQKLVRMELKKKGFDIDKIKIPKRVYLLADDIFDQMVSKTKEIAAMKYPLGGELYVFWQNETIGFIKSNMCSPAIATQAEDLIAGGVRELIHVGYAGGLQTDMKPGDVVITDGAYNDTAVARLYGYDWEVIHSSSGLTNAVEEELKKSGMAYKRGLHWTTDAGYRETYGQLLDYREKGALCVEMEGVGLFTIANYRNCLATGIYVISDLLATEWELGWDGKEIEKRVADITQWMIEQTWK